jgi:hypothetical protein
MQEIISEAKTVAGAVAEPLRLRLDQILTHVLKQDDTLMIRFMNGLFGDNIPLDAPVAWLDTKTSNDKYEGLVADYYPRIADKMYAIEIEQDDNGNMALRVFKYSVGGALLHNMTSTDSSVDITFPQPCVIFLKNTESTPRALTWNVTFFDGQKVTVEVPSIRIGDLSVEEIAKRDLFPIGQFYMRSFEPLANRDVETFRKAGKELLERLKEAVDSQRLSYHIAVEIQETIRTTVDNVLKRSEKEVDMDMFTSMTETLPWIDYSVVFAELEAKATAKGEARGRAEGRAEGEARGKARGKEDERRQWLKSAVNYLLDTGNVRNLRRVFPQLSNEEVKDVCAEADRAVARRRAEAAARDSGGEER